MTSQPQQETLLTAPMVVQSRNNVDNIPQLVCVSSESSQNALSDSWPTSIPLNLTAPGFTIETMEPIPNRKAKAPKRGESLRSPDPRGAADRTPLEHERALDALLQISHAVGSVMELPEILQRITAVTARVMKADVCSVFLHEPDVERLRLRATYGLNPDIVDQATIEPGEGVAGWVAATGQSAVIRNAPADPRFRPIEGSGEEHLRAFLCVPLHIQEEAIGVMTARFTECKDFDPFDITLFETIGKQVAIVIEKARLYHEKVDAERLAAIAVGLSEIAHYIKNLLQGIEGSAFIVEKALNANDIERARVGWAYLRRNNKKITTLVGNMLSYSRQEEADFVSGNINDLLRDVVESSVNHAERHDVELVESYDPTLPEIEFDEDYLHDALLNLVTNAIDAMPPDGGVVIVRTANLLEEERVLVEVEDTGEGIPLENQSKVFNIFFSTKGAKGTGIGLAATKKRVEIHGGTIEFDSTPGKGTTFRVCLPYRQEESIP